MVDGRVSKWQGRVDSEDQTSGRGTSGVCLVLYYGPAIQQLDGDGSGLPQR